jgi:hypothetical protein
MLVIVTEVTADAAPTAGEPTVAKKAVARAANTGVEVAMLQQLDDLTAKREFVGSSLRSGAPT